MTSQPAPRSRSSSGGLRIGRFRVSVPALVIGIALLASIGYILYVVRAVQDEQIKDLSFGFAAMGLCFAAIAVGSLFGMWGAASRAQGGRSFGLALIGGLAGLAAIGSFSVTALLVMLLNS